MFETRILDLNGCQLQHINYNENPFCENYIGVAGEEVNIYIANTEKQKEWLNRELNQFIDINVNIIKKINYTDGSICVISRNKIGNIIEKKNLNDYKIHTTNVTIKELLGDAPYLDFTYNRLDIKYGRSYKVLCVENASEKCYIPYHLEGDRVFLGVSMAPISTDCLQRVKEWFWENEATVNYLDMFFVQAYDKQLIPVNNYIIYFNDIGENLLDRLSRKSKYNYRREKRILEEKIGKIDIKKYDISDITKDMVDAYFDMKKKTKNKVYNMNWKEYLETYFVSNAYVLSDNKKIIGILFSCEKTQIAYLENFSYDTDYEKFSIGKILYYEFLNSLSKQGKKALYLAGGNYEYKKHFESENHFCFSGTISRNKEHVVKCRMLS